MHVLDVVEAEQGFRASRTATTSALPIGRGGRLLSQSYTKMVPIDRMRSGWQLVSCPRAIVSIHKLDDDVADDRIYTRSMPGP